MKQYPDIPLLDQDGLHRVPLRCYCCCCGLIYVGW